MKLQWKSVSPEQERRNSLLHGYRSLIGGLGVGVSRAEGPRRAGEREESQAPWFKPALPSTHLSSWQVILPLGSVSPCGRSATMVPEDVAG